MHLNCLNSITSMSLYKPNTSIITTNIITDRMLHRSLPASLCWTLYQLQSIFSSQSPEPVSPGRMAHIDWPILCWQQYNRPMAKNTNKSNKQSIHHNLDEHKTSGATWQLKPIIGVGHSKVETGLHITLARLGIQEQNQRKTDFKKSIAIRSKVNIDFKLINKRDFIIQLKVTHLTATTPSFIWQNKQTCQELLTLCTGLSAR